MWLNDLVSKWFFRNPCIDSGQLVIIRDTYMSGPQTQPARKGLGNNLARKCLAGMWRLLNSATHFLFQIFNVMGQALLHYSKFLCSTVYSLPVINWTRMLVGWSDVHSLINTDSSIPALKTLPGKVFPQTLPCRLGLGSRLYVYGVPAGVGKFIPRPLVTS